MKSMNVKKRKIGSVIIFDLFGSLIDGQATALRELLEKQIRAGHHHNVLLNTSQVKEADEFALRKILVALERPLRKAIYCESERLVRTFLNTYLSSQITICRSEEDVVKAFGQYLVEKNKMIEHKDRRRSLRIKVALPVKLKFAHNGQITTAKAIITNLSSGGIFVEYLSLDTAFAIRRLEDFKNVDISVIFKSMFSEQESEIKAKILRIEFSGRQTGMVLKYVEID